MKQPKRLTLEQKKAADAAGLIPENWMLYRETKEMLLLVSKSGKQHRTIEKLPRGRQSKRGK